MARSKQQGDNCILLPLGISLYFFENEKDILVIVNEDLDWALIENLLRPAVKDNPHTVSERKIFFASKFVYYLQLSTGLDIRWI